MHVCACVPHARPCCPLQVKPGWLNWLPQWDDNRAMLAAAESVLLAVAFLQRELLGRDSYLLAATEGVLPGTAGAGSSGSGAAGL